MGVLQKRWCWLGCMSYSWQSLNRSMPHHMLYKKTTKKNLNLQKNLLSFFSYSCTIYHTSWKIFHVFKFKKDKCLYSSWRFREVKIRMWIHAPSHATLTWNIESILENSHSAASIEMTMQIYNLAINRVPDSFWFCTACHQNFMPSLNLYDFFFSTEHKTRIQYNTMAVRQLNA